MNLTRASIKNPAAIVVIAILLLLFGIISLFKLPIQLTPDIEQPQISIGTGWRAAAPEEIESVIIEPIENVVKNTRGVTDVTTTINRGFGNITLTFDVGTDMQQAMLDVLNNLNQAPPLPLDAFEPSVSAGGGRGGPNAASLLVRPIPGSDLDSLENHQKLIEDVIEPRLARIQGVGRVNLNSQRPRELRITFDPYRAAALGITMGQIANTVSRATDVSGGFANVGRRQYTVRFAGQYDVSNLQDMIIAYSGERPVYLRDIATVEDTLVDRFGFTLRNGAPAYYITLTRANDANTVALLDDVNRAIKELNEGPLADAGLMLDLSFDSSVHIRNALTLVKSNLGLGVMLALAILWFFLRGLKATLIIGMTIPLSVMVAFLALSVLDRSLNVISLAGLAFAVGLVLDAAIIVQENIVRLRSEGVDNRKAVLKGAGQVTGALFASTATSVAIFLPILFMEGIEGQLFSDLALTLSVAVVASMVTAITILPVASYVVLKHVPNTDPFSTYWFRLTAFISKLTSTPTRRVGWIAGLLTASFAITWLLLPRTDFMPRAPTDGFFFSLNLPPGGNIHFLDEELAQRVKSRIEPYLSGEKQPKIKSYNFYSYGPGSTGGFIYSDDPTRVEELMDVARNDFLAGLPDTQVFLFRGSMINVSGNNGRSVNLNIQGPDMNVLMAAAKKGIAAVQEHMPNTSAQPSPALDMAEPEIQLRPDDRRIAQAGLTRLDVANAVRAFTGGMFITEYFDGNDRMNVILRADAWQSPEQLGATPIHTPLAGIQPLSELTEVVRTVGPTQLRRIDGQRTVSLIVRPPETMSLEEAMEHLDAHVIPVIQQELTGQSSINVAGNANKMNDAITDMITNFMLAVVILFLLMTALFKSAKDSLLVLTVMPLALGGGVLALWVLNLFTFQSLDLLTMIGFIILLGLVVNNAILLVDQTRVAEREGLHRSDAVAQAVRLRARPVYMSTLTSLFGMLPLMIVPGVGAEIYRGLATVIVGGMGISALFTLVYLPAWLRMGENKKSLQHVAGIPDPALATASPASSQNVVNLTK
ncbi:efflux RND transporter permease subunit [Aestuariibacter sp. AA17]|uniref:Efflux RND transporter permease subunit n=1 Tax=Fluctibacter corallii TaxID=2984329 RepID=A0ABT3A5Q0_9ALTE|nr:efflux RND transporter permease subunit [Aestuariibacter sp. AA17]MCV2883955.1 efflux RND transporter permease subunit [Aestuariibacter sp. AA17]